MASVLRLVSLGAAGLRGVRGLADASYRRAPRVWVGDEVTRAEGSSLGLSRAQLHYLTKSMRLRSGDAVRCFGARLGEQAATLDCDKRGNEGHLVLLEALREPVAADKAPAPLELVFAPLKRKRTAILVEKAVELGATARLLPACLPPLRWIEEAR